MTHLHPTIVNYTFIFLKLVWNVECPRTHKHKKITLNNMKLFNSLHMNQSLSLTKIIGRKSKCVYCNGARVLLFYYKWSQVIT